MDGARVLEIKARNRLRSLVFLEDGRHLLSADEEGIIRQWRCGDGVEVGDGIKTSSGLITAMVLSGDGNWIIVCGWKTANVLNRKAQTGAFTVSDHTDWVETVHISPHSTKFATGAGDKKAFIWDVLTGKQLVGPLEHEDRVKTVRFSPTGDRIATNSAESLRIYNADNGDLLNTVKVSTVPFTRGDLFVWSGAQNVFAFISQSTLAHIHLNARHTLSSWTTPSEKSSNFGYVSFSSNGKFVASAVGRFISLWDLSTYTQIGSTIQYSVQVWSIALSPDNNYLATGDANGTITLHNLNYIIPNYYLVGQRAVQPAQTGSEIDLQPRVEARCGELRVPDLRSDTPRMTTNLLTDRLQKHSVPVSMDGIYRIKSTTGDLYLACPKSTHGTVVVQESGQCNVLQRWTVSAAVDGTYRIMTREGNQDLSMSVGDTHALICVSGGEYTTWTIEPRGDAYVIGNAADAAVIHRIQNYQTVSVLLRDNSQNQRWVLERVTD